MYCIVFIAAFFVNQASLNQAASCRGWFTREANRPVASPAILSPNSFSFSSFDDKSCIPNSQLICSGAATAKHGHISLTKANKHSEVGKVLYRYPLTAWPDHFTTNFTFSIKKKSCSSYFGDGMTFLIASDNIPASKHNGRFDLGLMEISKRARKNLRQIAVAMDTYKNQIAVIKNSVEKPVIAKSLDSIGVQLTNGKSIKVQIEYNSLTKWLQISAGHVSEPPVKFLSIRIDMKAIVPSPIYVGFTAATRTLTETDELHHWDFKALNNHIYSSER